MSDDKPLHVQVAEALGWRHEPHLMPEWVAARPVTAWGWDPDGRHAIDRPPRYDTDWSATGPLIEKYELTVAANFTLDSGNHWIARTPGADLSCAGRTPLLAVCGLLLGLKEAGKL